MAATAELLSNCVYIHRVVSCFAAEADFCQGLALRILRFGEDCDDTDVGNQGGKIYKPAGFGNLRAGEEALR